MSQSDTDILRRGSLSETDPLLTNVELGYQSRALEIPKDPLEGAALHRDEGDSKSIRFLTLSALNLYPNPSVTHGESFDNVPQAKRQLGIRLELSPTYTTF